MTSNFRKMGWYVSRIWFRSTVLFKSPTTRSDSSQYFEVTGDTRTKDFHLKTSLEDA